MSVCRSVGRSVGLSVCRSVRGKNLNQRYELVHWYFVYKLNKLLWNLGKRSLYNPKCQSDYGSVHLSVCMSVKNILHNRNATLFRNVHGRSLQHICACYCQNPNLTTTQLNLSPTQFGLTQFLLFTPPQNHPPPTGTLLLLERLIPAQIILGKCIYPVKGIYQFPL